MLKPFLLMLFSLVLFSPVRADDITGTVTNPAGEPLAGVRIDISTAGPKVGRGVFCPSCYLDCRKRSKTDSNGKFVISSVDRNLRFHLLASGSGMKTTQTDWVDPVAGAVTIRMEEFPKVDAKHLLLGKVVNAQGIPVAGALVSPAGAKQNEKRWKGDVPGAEPAVTDEQGQFQLLLHNDFQGLDVEILADGSSGMIVDLLEPGEKVHQLTIPTGTKVSGRLTVLGKPAAKQPVAVVQLYRASTDIFIKSVLTYSDAEGKFVFEYLPADQPYVIFTPRGIPSTGLALPTAMFQAKSDDQTRDLGALELKAGYVLAGRLLLEKDKPIPAALTIAVGREPAWDLIEIPVDSEGKFRIENLPPETYRLSVNADEFLIDETKVNYHLVHERTIAVGLSKDISDIEIPVRSLRKGEPAMNRGYQSRPPKPGTQRLTGIVVDRAGQPLSGIRIDVELTAAFGRARPSLLTRTSADGRFELSGLPDQPLSLVFSSPQSHNYPASKTAMMIPYRGYVRTTMNQSNVRFVLDPEVYAKLRDLKWRKLEGTKQVPRRTTISQHRSTDQINPDPRKTENFRQLPCLVFSGFSHTLNVLVDIRLSNCPALDSIHLNPLVVKWPDTRGPSNILFGVKIQ